MWLPLINVTFVQNNPNKHPHHKYSLTPHYLYKFKNQTNPINSVIKAPMTDLP